MFSCFKCNNFRTESASCIVKHLRNFQDLSDGPTLNLNCCVSSCRTPFKTFSGLRKHLVSKHAEQTVMPKSTENISDPSMSYSFNDEIQTPEKLPKPDETHNVLCSESGTVISEDTDSVLSDDNISLLFSTFASQLYSLGLTSTANQKILDYSAELITSLLNIVKTCASTHEHVTRDNTSIINLINMFQKSLLKFNTVYKVKKQFMEKVVKPKEIAIGTRIEKVFDSISNRYVDQNVTSSFMYVPVLDTLKSVITDDFIQYYDRNLPKNSDRVEDIYDGSIIKDNMLLSSKGNILQIQLFFDEFEVCNPLGSKAGVHKLGAIYFVLRNIPPFFNSFLNHIHLVALFYSLDLKCISFNKILCPIVNDIKILETKGIVVQDRQFFGTLVALSHDNLGANMLFGMVQSFNATNFCRICLVNKSVTQSLTSKREDLLRTPALYEEHTSGINANVPIVFGIKERSVLNDLHYFKLHSNISVDIMHDVLEAVGQLELKLFMKFLIENKYSTIHELNNRIQSFDYGLINTKNKPSVFSLDKPGHLLGQKAVQTWVLIRYFPLIVSDYLEIENVYKHWILIEKLLQIMSIIFAPRIDRNNNLRELIKEHHALFLSLHNSNLTPKHHVMTHYDTCIKLMGPLVYLRSLRFEGKHAFFKSHTKLFNFKNVAKSLAERHQQLTLFYYQSLYEVPSEYGPLETVHVENYIYKESLTDYIDISNSEIIRRTKWLKMGYYYTKNFMLCLRVENNGPVFGKILEIIIFESAIFF